MTPRQILLKATYPLLMLSKKNTAKILRNETRLKPDRSFYDLCIDLNDGKKFFFDSLRGKKVLIVNTASDCGYTQQYAQLEDLYQRYKSKLQVIGFPANDFKQQEKGTDAEIATFCRVNFRLSFLLARKSKVVKGSEQNSVFVWLTNKENNGWNDQQPTWNFCKYLVDENGVLLNFFSTGVSPLSKELLDRIDKA